MAALVGRLLYLGELAGTLPFSTLVIDGRAYDAWAREIASGQWWGTEVFYQAPLYPYLLAAIYSVFGPSAMVVRVIQCVFGAVACILITLCGNRLFGIRSGWIAGIMLAVYPPAIFFDGLIQKASLDLLLVCSLLWLIVQLQYRRSWPWLVAVAVAVAALMLNRENARIAYPLLLVWILVEFSDQSLAKRWLWAGTFTLAMGLVLLPVGMRNYLVGGEFLLTTSQVGPNFYIGNNAQANGTYQPLVPGRGDPKYERRDATRLAEQASGGQLTPREVSNYWLGQSISYILNQPLDWLKLMAWKSLLTVHAIEVIDSESISLYAHYSALLRWLYRCWHCGILMPLAAWGLWITRFEWRRLWVFYGLFGLLAASTAIFFVFARYRYPLVPLAVLFASAGLAVLPEWVSTIRRQVRSIHWVLGATGVLIVAMICNWPLSSLEDDARSYSNLGIGLLDDDRPSDALAAFDHAIQLEPQFADAIYNKGIALESLDRREEAIRLFEQAIRLKPTLGGAHSRLAQYYVDCGNVDKATYHFGQAIALVAEPALLHFEYGQLLVGQGDTLGAIAQYRAALKLDSGIVLAANNLAWLLATDSRPEVRSVAEAIQIAEKLAERISRSPDDTHTEAEVTILDTLSAAYAEAGRFDEAVRTAQRGLEIASLLADTSLTEMMQSRIELYRTGKPFRSQ
ncbi:MAG: tetratricopeptide repeat protein [Pirellulaceae bacterium]|nr:tetratricopeptide repeat protein [Pirellulaceae bacterium]